MSNKLTTVTPLLLLIACAPDPTDIDEDAIRSRAWADPVHAQICMNSATRQRHLEIIRDNFLWIEAQGRPEHTGDGLIGTTDLQAALAAATPGTPLHDALGFLLGDVAFFNLLDIESVASRGEVDGIFGVSDVIAMLTDLKQCGAVEQSGGHATDNCSTYDIYRHNCHTAATAGCTGGVCAPGIHVGIVKCGGNPEDVSQPMYHTFNWRVDDNTGQTCFLNWGNSCCFAGTAQPPAFAGTMCAMFVADACKGQATNITVLPEGTTIEYPGANTCVRETSDRTSCTACCDRRAAIDWGDDLPGYNWRSREAFIAECKAACTNFR